MKKIFSMMVAVAMLLMSCTVFAATDISDGVLRVEGVGALQNRTPADGYRAAKVDAMRNALEEVQGVRIDSETTVRESITASDVIRTRINGMLQGARVVEKYKDGDGYHVFIEVPVYGVQSLASAVIPPTTTAPAPLPSVTVFAPQAPATSGPYTGLIVDCTGLGLETAMAPGIFATDNQMVYGQVNFSHDFVINHGYVGYAKSLTVNVSRAGSNPLIIRAQSITRFVNPVISPADAARVLAENQVTGFLTQGKVVFVK